MDYLKNQELNKYFSTSQTGFWKVEMENGVKSRLYVDKIMQELIGAPDDLTPEECYTFFASHIHPEDQKLMIPYGMDLMRGNAEVIYRYLHPKYGEIHVRCGGSKVENDSDIITIIGYHKELSDIIHLENNNRREELLLRRSREVQLKKSQNYYWQLMNKTSCGIIAYTLKDHQIQFLNDEAMRILGVKDIKEAKECIFGIMKKIIYPNPIVIKKLLNLQKKDDKEDYECIITGKNGCITSVLAHTEVITTLYGERSVFTTILDISENKLLKDERSILKALCADFLFVYLCDLEKNNSVALNIIINPDNSDTLTMDRYMQNQLNNKGNDYNEKIKLYFDLYVDKESSPDFLDKLDANFLMEYLPNHGGHFSYRYKVKELKSKYENFEVKIFQLSNNDGFKVVMGFRGIDEIIHEEEVQRKAAEKANEAKSKFLFNMSHDIRTPMNALLGYNQLIKKKLKDPELLSYQDKIEKSGNILLSIINNVLDMARIESGKEEIDENYVRVSEVSNELIEVFSEEANKKNITLLHDVKVKKDHVMCDIIKVKEIYINLLSNAIKYTPSGGTIRLNSYQIPSNKEGYVCIQTEVIDNGIGMSKEFLPKLFDSFTREHNTTAGKVSGTGLGMPIVKKLVELMGGTITVESELGKGSKFVVTLFHKIADSAYYQQKVVKYTEIEKKELFKGKHILLAEDNDLNAEITISILQDIGLIVDRVEDGIQCVAKIEKMPANSYDLILMDIQMPHMDGYKATKVIRSLENKAKANIPIIAMTANAFDEDKQNAFASGMNGHIAKPIDIQKFEKYLLSFLQTSNKT